MAKAWRNLLKIFSKLPGLIYVMPEALKNLNSSRCIFWTKKILFTTVWALIGLCLVEILFRLRNCTFSMMRRINNNVITKLKVAMQTGTYVTRVTLCMIIRTNVTKLSPCAVLHHPVLKIRLGIVLHAKVVSQWEMFPESFKSRSWRQVGLSVETGMSKLQLFHYFG